MGTGFWYNYAAQDYEHSDAPVTDEEAKRYIPQDEAAQAIYQIRREMGDSILHAMAYTLEASAGIPHNAPAA